MDKKTAVIIVDTEKDAEGNYIPCLVTEGETGYVPTDWKWGTDRKVAQKLADDYNEGLGVSRKEAIEITLKSMAKTIVYHAICHTCNVELVWDTDKNRVEEEARKHKTKNPRHFVIIGTEVK